MRNYTDFERGCRCFARDRLRRGRGLWNCTNQSPCWDVRRALLQLAQPCLGCSATRVATCGLTLPNASQLGARAGPTTIKGVFHSREELSMHVIYLDPVHDFAFLRCDVAALRVRAQAAVLHAGAGLLAVSTVGGNKLSQNAEMCLSSVCSAALEQHTATRQKCR